MSHWPVQKFPLSPPDLHELVPSITSGLAKNFKQVSVQVSPCPDLRQKPFCLAAAGLSGNARIADIGGPPNLSPTPKWDRKYSLLDMARLMEMSETKGFLLGAGAGPFHVLGTNSELMPNLAYEEGGTVTNLTHYAKIIDNNDGNEQGGGGGGGDSHSDSGAYTCAKSPSQDCALMANLFGSDGNPGDVLKILVKTRTGTMNFTETIQRALKTAYGGADRTISLGGVFVINSGKANLHVMPDFSKTPLETPEAVGRWLRYFEMEAPLVCLSVFHSHDPGLDLRMEHTHCFSEHNQGGHYHDDTTPDEVEYEAYFNVASAIYRIDRPQV